MQKEQMKYVDINNVIENDSNPRNISEVKFAKLVNSIENFPQMLDLRPLIVNEDMVVLGGNMRLKACRQLGLKKVPVIQVKNLTEEQQKEFVIKDNVGFGDWDWDVLGNEWDTELLEKWGLDLFGIAEDVDYSILDDADDIDAELESMIDNVKKSIQIEFNPEHFEEAKELIKFWRDKEAYIGLWLIDKLKQEKERM